MEDDQDGFKYTLMCFLCFCVCVCLCSNVDYTLTLCSPQPKPSPSVCLVACPYFCFLVLLLFALKRMVNCACFSLFVGPYLSLFAINHRYYCVYTRAAFIFTLIFSFFSLRPPPTLSLPLLSSLFVFQSKAFTSPRPLYLSFCFCLSRLCPPTPCLSTSGSCTLLPLDILSRGSSAAF